MRPAVKIDFSHKFRLNPNGRTHAALLRRRCAKRRFIRYERFEFAVKLPRSLMREAGPGAAGVKQFAILVIAQYQRTDGAGIRSGWRKAGDYQFLPFGAFGLDPIVTTAGMIGSIA